MYVEKYCVPFEKYIDRKSIRLNILLGQIIEEISTEVVVKAQSVCWSEVFPEVCSAIQGPFIMKFPLHSLVFLGAFTNGPDDWFSILFGTSLQFGHCPDHCHYRDPLQVI